jgi:hypothetical protein
VDNRFSFSVQGRQFLRTGQSELLQEFERGPVDNRTAHLFQATLFLDETSIDECSEDAVRVDSAYALNLGAGRWLTVALRAVHSLGPDLAATLLLARVRPARW